jgi:hypothetical protein
MKKKEELTKRQNAMMDILDSRDTSEPEKQVQKMDKIIVVYCAPYYQDSPAFSKAIALWDDMKTNFSSIRDHREVSRIVVNSYFSFVVDMIYALSWRNRDLPGNYVYIQAPGWIDSPPQRYDYEP